MLGDSEAPESPVSRNDFATWRKPLQRNVLSYSQALPILSIGALLIEICLGVETIDSLETPDFHRSPDSAP
jgi:hypothetical protein